MPGRSPPLIHAAGAPGSLPLSSSQQAPRGEAPSPSPAASLPLFPGRPWTSRGSFSAKVALLWATMSCRGATGPAHFLGAGPCLEARGCPSPGAFWGAVVFMGKQREEQAVLGLHCQDTPLRRWAPRSDTRHPATGPRCAGACNPIPCGTGPSLAPPSPATELSPGRLSLLPPGRAVGRRPGSSSRGAGLPRAHITSSGGGGGGGEAPLPVCPPLGAPSGCCARRRGPRIPWLFLGWPYQPSCPRAAGCHPARLSHRAAPHRARPGRNPVPGSPRPCGKVGTPSVTGTAWGSTRGAHGGQFWHWGRGLRGCTHPWGALVAGGCFLQLREDPDPLPRCRCSLGTFGAL